MNWEMVEGKRVANSSGGFSKSPTLDSAFHHISISNHHTRHRAVITINVPVAFTSHTNEGDDEREPENMKMHRKRTGIEKSKRAIQ